MKALILAGGSGTRFWPLSRRDRPKQFLPLTGERSLLQATADRLEPLVGLSDVWVCTTRRLANGVAEQLDGLPAHQILAEPTGRNTAPAIAWAVSCMPERDREQVVAVLPSDHWMTDARGFRDTLEKAARAIEGSAPGRVMTLGVTPRWPETGYGYLELESEPRTEEPTKVVRFTEKPDLERAQAFVDGGRHLWNAGIFLFRGTTLLDLIERYQPQIAKGLERLREIESAGGDPEAMLRTYSELPAESIDTGVMEKHDDIATQSLDCGWNDLGSWEAITELVGADADENRSRGATLAVDARDNLLWADRGTIAVLGVEGLAVIRTADAVLVVPRERAQDVRDIVDELERRGRDDLL